MAKDLIKPCLDHEDSYRSYIAELGDEERYPFPLDFDHSDFGLLLERLADLEAGRNLPPGRVPSSTYWLLENGEILGVSNLRHFLNDQLRHCGGHIGLGVRPSLRGRGVGTRLLGMTIDQARARGIATVHIHCHRENKPSAGMIMRQGGTLHSEVEQPDSGKVVQRYLVRT